MGINFQNYFHHYDPKAKYMLVYCGDWLSEWPSSLWSRSKVYVGILWDWLSVPTDTQYCYASLNLPFFSLLSLSLFWFYLLYLFCTCVFFIIHIFGVLFLSIPSVCCCWNCNKFPRLVIKWHMPHHIYNYSRLHIIPVISFRLYPIIFWK